MKMLLAFYFLGGHMIDYRKRKTTKCTDPECICWFCKNKRIQALQNAKTGTAGIVKENIQIQHDFVRIMLTDE